MSTPIEYIPSSEFDLCSQMAAVRRELAFRRLVYRRKVDDKTMTAEQAARQIGAMRAVLNTLTDLYAREGNERQPKLL